MADTNNAASTANNRGGSVQQVTTQNTRDPGSSYSVQAADAGTDERSGTDGGRGLPPNHEATNTTLADVSPEEDVATLKAALKAARAEAAAHRKKATEYDALLKQQEDAKLSETERLQKQYAEAQQQIEALRLEKQEIALRSEIRGVAASLGLKPELALRVLDQNAVTYDDNGIPTNITTLLEQAIQDYGLDYGLSASPATQAASGASSSSAQKPAVTSGGATAPARSASGNNGQHSLAAGEWTDERVARLTREEYLANRASINAWREKRGRGEGYRW